MAREKLAETRKLNIAPPNSLFHGIEAPANNDGQNEPAILVKRGHIHPWDDQPRKYFSQPDLEALAADFKELGFQGTILVRPHPKKGAGHYEIVDGERSWRAAQIAKIDELACVVADLDDASAMQLAIAKNHFREELSALELTEAIIRLIIYRLDHVAREDSSVAVMNEEEVIAFIRTEMHPRKLQKSGIDVDTTIKQILETIEFHGIAYTTFYAKYMGLLNAPDFLKRAHLEENVSFRTVLAIEGVRPKGKATLPKRRKEAEQKQRELLRRVIDENLGYRAVKEAVKEIKDEMKPRLPAKAEKIHTRLEKSWKSINKPEVWQNKALAGHLEDLAAQMEAVLVEIDQ